MGSLPSFSAVPPASFPVASPPSSSSAIVSPPSSPIPSPPPSSQLTPKQSTTATPFIQCPSAMKCVPKVNCDFNGVMVNFIVRLNSIQEQQRVPLIPCLNQDQGSVDVCCRDPNYKDPWPDMDGGAQGNVPSFSNQAQPSRTNDNKGGSPTQSLAQQLAANKNVNVPSQL